MFACLTRYARWLHTGWPAGRVEKLPEVRPLGQPDGSTNVPGLYIVGDLTGIPLLKFAADTGAKAVRTIHGELASGASPARRQAGRPAEQPSDVLDLAIVGAGVSGMAAALEARKLGLRFEILEAAEPFATIVNFPKGKPIYTYPSAMTPAGDLALTADVKERLVEELRAQMSAGGIRPRIARVERVAAGSGFLSVILAEGPPLTARRVIVAIGQSGQFRKLGVPGEDLDKVYNRLHDPNDFRGKNVLVVGGGDSALEAAVAIAECDAAVTLSYRGREFTRPKPQNIERLKRLAVSPSDAAPAPPGRIRAMMGSRVKRIDPAVATLIRNDGREEIVPNDATFVLIGREAPLAFLRRCGVRIAGEMGVRQWVAFAGFFAFCLFLYNWKAGGDLKRVFEARQWFPYNVPPFLKGLGGAVAAMAQDASTLLGTLTISLEEPGFYYSLAYCVCVVAFGIRRIRRKKTPYVRVQTLTLMAIQVVPLFLLPYILLPYLGHNGLFDSGWRKAVGDSLFPDGGYGHGREYWRSVGFILAWPLFIWNVFAGKPLMAWLIISLVQTFVLIPLAVWRWGKGAYCGWVCSCGALAETLGDGSRHKMPHGPAWNRLNMVGQAILAVACLLLVLRVVSWIWPESGGTTPGRAVGGLYAGLLAGWRLGGIPVNYAWIVDVFLAGVVGVSCYFWFSGRVWCRFACPLAALMHIYARFTRFRIIPEKSKCISCNVCTSVCHQGIDVMSFANKGLPMADPQCVRCSACVQSCPTGVLQFGRVDPRTGDVAAIDALAASPVLMRERATAVGTPAASDPTKLAYAVKSFASKRR